MADPVTGLAAVAAASSIIQVIHFSASCIAEITKLWASDELGLQDNIALEQWVDQQHTFADSLITSHHDPSRAPSTEQMNVENIAKELRREAQILLDLLRSVKVQEGLVGLERKWRVCVQTIKALKKRKTIEAHQKHLQEIHVFLTNVLLQIIRDEATEWSKELNLTLMPALERLLHAVEQTEVKNARSVVELQRILLHTAKEHASRLERQIEEGFAELKRREESRAEAKRDAAKTTRIIGSLYNPAMSMRRNAILPAHAHTFEWIFEDDSSPFRKWLASGSGTIWINGFAGSGKSTLMKYISNATETEQILTQWAEHGSVFVIETYFWNPGTLLQKSEQGLLQAILYQVLSACNDLVRVATPLRWKRSHRYQQQEPWSRDELLEALMRVLEQPNNTAYFCVFVDGLDECQGDRTKLVEFVQRLTQTPRLKICASSRPRNAFGELSVECLGSSLSIQDFTGEDIRRFVLDELGKAIRSNPQHVELADVIVSEAQGIFLWVFLVVRSLREGFGEGDGFEMMHQRVNGLPSELEEYYKRIFDDSGPVYQRDACRILKITAAFAAKGRTASFIVYWLLKQGIDDQDFAFQQGERDLQFHDLASMIMEIQTFLNARCKDFLRVPDLKSNSTFDVLNYLLQSRVEFLHKTALDFCSTGHMRDVLNLNVPTHFKSPMFLSHLYIAQTQIQSMLIDTTFPGSCMCSVGSMRMALHYLDHSHSTASKTVAAMEDLVLHHARNSDCHECRQSRGMSYHESNLAELFLAYGLRDHIDEIIALRPNIQLSDERVETAHLARAALGISSCRPFPMTDIDTDVLKALLQHEASTKGVWTGFVVKLALEQRLSHPSRAGFLAKAVEAAKMLLAYGADTTPKVRRKAAAPRSSQRPSLAG
ncbi:hypothetical protein TI39_contig412g00036 [Zymoseptoria brevis]|uniref:Uncharacterized protein n=1 Tax=Zymoseptoria brevis TaxID=1047168 RepID=A0A0F4GQF3_9PEZI|nr:hypothetical protein TI39_contig412g00036 [Zymoseptoria brevis]